MSADKITSLSIEMADLEPKALAVRELRDKQQAVQELDEVGSRVGQRVSYGLYLTNN